MSTLREKIKNKSAVIGVVGMGYVGLPLAIAFTNAGYKVYGFDILKQRVKLINQGKSYLNDVSDKELQSVIVKGNFKATTDKRMLTETDVICICVPTPLTKTKDPDLSLVIQESGNISKYVHKNQLIILESTTYPGTTREIVKPIIESAKLKAGKDFYLAFSPERVDPGNTKYNIKNTTKIVGGINKESTDLAQILYSQVAETTLPVSCPEVAEMTKVFENVFRSVNIALVNELAQLCNRMGISVWEVIDSASTKPFGFMPFYPGPGVGGHCIPLDPYYLAFKAREYDFHTHFIELAAEVNENMPYYVAYKIMEILNEQSKNIKDAKILLLGITYKKDSQDLRESASLKLLEILYEKNKTISYNDPYVHQIQLGHIELKSTPLTKRILSSADCIIIATNHTSYDYKNIVSNAKLIYDTRGVTRKYSGKNIIRMGE